MFSRASVGKNFFESRSQIFIFFIFLKQKGVPKHLNTIKYYIILGDTMKDKYTPRHIRLKESHIEKLNELKEVSGRSQTWVINRALDYLFENEWDNLIK